MEKDFKEALEGLKSEVVEKQKELKQNQEEFSKKLVTMQKELEEKGKDNPDFKAFEEKINAESVKNLEKVDELGKQLKELGEAQKRYDDLLSSHNPETDEAHMKEMTSEFVKSLGHGKIDGNTVVERNEKNINDLVEKNFPGLDEKEKEFKIQEIKTYLVGNDPTGGIVVPTQFSQNIIQRKFESSVMRRVATVIQGTSDTFVVPIDASAMLTGWAGETDTRSETKGQDFAEIKIEAHEMFAMPKMSNKWMHNAYVNADGYIANAISGALSRTENLAFVSGNGVKKPKGFINEDTYTGTSVFSKGKLQSLAMATSSIDADEIMKLQAYLLPEYEAGAKFAMSNLMFLEVTQLKNDQGDYLLNPRVLWEGSKKMLLGKEVLPFNDMAKTVASGAVTIAYGDFKGYTIYDRLGLMLINDNVTAKGFTLKYFYQYTGGQVTDHQSIKLMTKA